MISHSPSYCSGLDVAPGSATAKYSWREWTAFNLPLFVSDVEHRGRIERTGPERLHEMQIAFRQTHGHL